MSTLISQQFNLFIFHHHSKCIYLHSCMIFLKAPYLCLCRIHLSEDYLSTHDEQLVCFAYPFFVLILFLVHWKDYLELGIMACLVFPFKLGAENCKSSFCSIKLMGHLSQIESTTFLVMTLANVAYIIFILFCDGFFKCCAIFKSSNNMIICFTLQYIQVLLLLSQYENTS